MVISESIALLLLLLSNSCWSYALLFDPHQFPWYLAIDFINFSLAHFVADIEACRLWLICYQLHYLKATKNQKWKMLIDRSFAERDWYLCNKTRWGNTSFVFKRAAVCYFIGFIVRMVYLVWCFQQPRSWRADYIYVLDAILFCFPILLINWSYLKSPKQLCDLLFFHFEFKATIIAYIVAYVVFVCILAVLMLFSGDRNIALVLARIAMLGGAAIPSYLSTIYIPYKIRSSPYWVCKL